MQHLPKKFTFLLVLISSFFLLAKVVLAVAAEDAGVGGSSGYGGYFDKNLQNYLQDLKEQALSGEVTHDTFFAASGNSFTNWLLYQGEGVACVAGQTCQVGGVLGSVNQMVSYLCLHPPASGAEYLADLGQSFGLAKPAYAQQGIGFKYFAPILPVWKITRNLAYLIFVIIFIITGLAIMFRVKISPQAVLTLESALPKVVVALILVTFSYAIAGFLIDIIYILIGVFLAILRPAGLSDYSFAAYSNNPTIGTFIGWYITIGFGFASELAGGLSKTIGEGIQFPILRSLPVIGGEIAGGITHLILLIALIFAFFKLFFTLLMCYINIILGIIMGPITIMLSALPGEQTNSFSKWVQDLLANTMTFPAVIGIFVLADLINASTNQNVNPIWSPPLLFSTNSAFVGGLVSFGLLMLAPNVPTYIKAMFNPKEKVPPMTQSFFAPIGAGAGVVKTPISYPGGLIKQAKEKRFIQDVQDYGGLTALADRFGIRRKGGTAEETTRPEETQSSRPAGFAGMSKQYQEPKQDQPKKA